MANYFFNSNHCGSICSFGFMAWYYWGIYEIFTDDFDDCSRLFPICCSGYQSGFSSNIHESYAESTQQEKDCNKLFILYLSWNLFYCLWLGIIREFRSIYSPIVSSELIHFLTWNKNISKQILTKTRKSLRKISSICNQRQASFGLFRWDYFTFNFFIRSVRYISAKSGILPK